MSYNRALGCSPGCLQAHKKSTIMTMYELHCTQPALLLKSFHSVAILGTQLGIYTVCFKLQSREEHGLSVICSVQETKPQQFIN